MLRIRRHSLWDWFLALKRRWEVELVGCSRRRWRKQLPTVIIRNYGFKLLLCHIQFQCCLFSSLLLLLLGRLSVYSAPSNGVNQRERVYRLNSITPSDIFDPLSLWNNLNQPASNLNLQVNGFLLPFLAPLFPITKVTCKVSFLWHIQHCMVCTYVYPCHVIALPSLSVFFFLALTAVLWFSIWITESWKYDLLHISSRCSTTRAERRQTTTWRTRQRGWQTGSQQEEKDDMTRLFQEQLEQRKG